ncbi:MAG TPA: glycosyltransferase family 4 protein [Methanoregulaceae archaeon]|nr:glycosyltransferase family 4 protein [Methanoregulaceae archaeon]
MKILVIPTTDWTRHPVPNRLNFIFDILAERNEVFVLHFGIGQFSNNIPRETHCTLINSGPIPAKDPSLFYLLNAPFHLASLLRTVRREEIDVIVSANILPSFLASLGDTPVVFDYLDHLEESASVYYPGSLLGRVIRSGVKAITSFNLRQSTSIITVSSDFSQYLADAGLTGVTVIPNGVDTATLSPLPTIEAKQKLGLDGPVLGYVGSLEYWVDLESVISALPSLDVTLLVVGPGLFTDYGTHIQRLADDCGVSDRVIFTGLVPFSDLGLYISAMDIGLNPLKKMAKNEMTVGGKVFNYLACGKPVLSSRMAALEHMLGDALFYYDDVPSFVSQTASILAAPGDPSRYRDIALHYDWRHLAARYEKVLVSASGRTVP